MRWKTFSFLTILSFVAAARADVVEGTGQYVHNSTRAAYGDRGFNVSTGIIRGELCFKDNTCMTTAGGGGSPVGPNFSVQFSSGGAFNGNSSFTYNGTTVSVLGVLSFGTAGYIKNSGGVLQMVNPIDAIEITASQDVTLSATNLDLEGKQGTLLHDLSNITLQSPIVEIGQNVGLHFESNQIEVLQPFNGNINNPEFNYFDMTGGGKIILRAGSGAGSGSPATLEMTDSGGSSIIGHTNYWGFALPADDNTVQFDEWSAGTVTTGNSEGFTFYGLHNPLLQIVPGDTAASTVTFKVNGDWAGAGSSYGHGWFLQAENSNHATKGGNLILGGGFGDTGKPNGDVIVSSWSALKPYNVTLSSGLNFPDGSRMVTAATSGSTIYNATATAGFPYGLKTSTAFVTDNFQVGYGGGDTGLSFQAGNGCFNSDFCAQNVDGILHINSSFTSNGSKISFDTGGTQKGLIYWDNANNAMSFDNNLNIPGVLRGTTEYFANRVMIGTNTLQAYPLNVWNKVPSGSSWQQAALVNQSDYISGISFARSGGTAGGIWQFYRYGSAQGDKFCFGVNGVNEPFCASPASDDPVFTLSSQLAQFDMQLSGVFHVFNGPDGNSMTLNSGASFGLGDNAAFNITSGQGGFFSASFSQASPDSTAGDNIIVGSRGGPDGGGGGGRGSDIIFSPGSIDSGVSGDLVRGGTVIMKNQDTTAIRGPDSFTGFNSLPGAFIYQRDIGGQDEPVLYMEGNWPSMVLADTQSPQLLTGLSSEVGGQVFSIGSNFFQLAFGSNNGAHPGMYQRFDLRGGFEDVAYQLTYIPTGAGEQFIVGVSTTGKLGIRDNRIVYNFQSGNPGTLKWNTSGTRTQTIQDVTGTLADLEINQTWPSTQTIQSLIVSSSTIYTSSKTANVSTNQNDYALPNASVVYSSATAAFTFTGFAARPSDYEFTLVNVGTNTITLADESASSSAANRIRTNTGSNTTLAGTTTGGASASFHYDGNISRWRQLR